MKKAFKGFLFLTLLMLVLAGCSTKAPGSTDKASSKEMKSGKLKIGLSISTLNNPFFVSLKEGAEKEAKAQGADIITVDSQNDSAKQVSDIEDLGRSGRR